MSTANRNRQQFSFWFVDSGEFLPHQVTNCSLCRPRLKTKNLNFKCSISFRNLSGKILFHFYYCRAWSNFQIVHCGSWSCWKHLRRRVLTRCCCCCCWNRRCVTQSHTRRWSLSSRVSLFALCWSGVTTSVALTELMLICPTLSHFHKIKVCLSRMWSEHHRLLTSVAW